MADQLTTVSKKRLINKVETVSKNEMEDRANYYDPICSLRKNTCFH